MVFDIRVFLRIDAVIERWKWQSMKLVYPHESSKLHCNYPENRRMSYPVGSLISSRDSSGMIV